MSTQASVKIITGNSVKSVEFSTDENLTVQQALDRAGVVLTASQSVARNGSPAQLDDEIEDGDRLAAGGNKASGTR